MKNILLRRCASTVTLAALEGTLRLYGTNDSLEQIPAR
jgi:hypothetical protein